MKQNTILLTYLGMGRLNQKRARKSSEQVRKAASVGECVIKRTAPLCPSESSCFLEGAFILYVSTPVFFYPPQHFHEFFSIFFSHFYTKNFKVRHENFIKM